MLSWGLWLQNFPRRTCPWPPRGVKHLYCRDTLKRSTFWQVWLPPPSKRLATSLLAVMLCSLHNGTGSTGSKAADLASKFYRSEKYEYAYNKLGCSGQHRSLAGSLSSQRSFFMIHASVQHHTLHQFTQLEGTSTFLSAKCACLANLAVWFIIPFNIYLLSYWNDWVCLWGLIKLKVLDTCVRSVFLFFNASIYMTWTCVMLTICSAY